MGAEGKRHLLPQQHEESAGGRRIDGVELERIPKCLPDAAELLRADILSDDRSYRAAECEDDAKRHWHQPRDDGDRRHRVVSERGGCGGHIGVCEGSGELCEHRRGRHRQDRREVASEALHAEGRQEPVRPMNAEPSHCEGPAVAGQRCDGGSPDAEPETEDQDGIEDRRDHGDHERDVHRPACIAEPPQDEAERHSGAQQRKTGAEYPNIEFCQLQRLAACPEQQQKTVGFERNAACDHE